MKTWLVVAVLTLTDNWRDAFAPQTWSNWGLVFVGIGAIVAALCTLSVIRRQTDHVARQARSMRYQTKHLRNSVIQGSRAAKAALLNARSVINSERAWIGITLGLPVKDPFDDDDDGYLKYSIQIANHGRTVARVESFQVGAFCTSGNLRLEDLPRVTKDFNTLLGNGDKPSVVTTINLGDSFSDWDSINNGTKKGFLRIAVQYRDVVEGAALHESSAVYIWNINLENPERLAIYNTYT